MYNNYLISFPCFLLFCFLNHKITSATTIVVIMNRTGIMIITTIMPVEISSTKHKNSDMLMFQFVNVSVCQMYVQQYMY